MGHERGSAYMTDSSDADSTGDKATLERAVEAFLRDARRVYDEYEEDYLDPDAALWTLDGHIDSLEDALDARGGRGERDERN